MRIALLEDDPAQSDLVRHWLVGAGHIVHAYARSLDLEHRLARESFDLFILDWELPDVPGIEVLGWLRRQRQDPAPVLFATARDTEEDIAAALTAGADDYVVKPLRRLELLARVEALGRRAHPPAPKAACIAVEDVVIDLERRTVTRGGQLIELTQKDFDLAAFMFRNVGQLVSRGHILESVWGRTAMLNTRTVDTHISRLRAKLGLTPEKGWRLSAIYQHGYRLEPVQAASANDVAERRQA